MDDFQRGYFTGVAVSIVVNVGLYLGWGLLLIIF
jgi:hypothetical protein